MKQALFLRLFQQDQMIAVKQFTKEQIVVGSGADVDLCIEDASISPIHSMIEERGERYYVCDLGSATGTKKNGQTVLDEPIESGDVIEVGKFKIEFYVGVPKPKNKPSEHTSVTSATALKPVETSKISAPAAPTTPAEQFVVAEHKQPVEPKQSAETKQKVQKPVEKVHKESHSQFETVSGMAPKSHGTYAPPSAYDDLSKELKMGAGTAVEMVVAWGQRILSSHVFTEKKVITIGGHPKNDIILPVFDGSRVSHPILRVDSTSQIYITTDMSGEVIRDNTRTPFTALIAQNKMTRSGAGYTLTIEQGTLIKVNLGSQICLYFRCAAAAPRPGMPPFLFMTSTEFTGLIVAGILTAIMAVYVTVYRPQEVPPPPDEVTRMAKFEYQKPKQTIVPEEEKKQEAAKEPKAPDAKKAEKAKTAQRDSFDEVGAASKASPNKSKSKEKVLTAPNPGKDKGITKAQSNAKSQDSSAKSAKKDVTKSGLFSAFGTKGTQDMLNKVYAGSGVVGGLSKNATGSGGQGAAGSGVIPGAGLKAVGAGDNGTATVGIAGVNTKGRGGGLEGYGSGSIGGKKGSTVIPGGAEETFIGTIDKEAVRRVIHSNKNVIRSCYERALNKHPDLDGKVILEWEIGPGGLVLSAAVKSSTLNSAEVEQCLVSRLKTWRFPEPPKDTTASVVFPFVFRAQ